MCVKNKVNGGASFRKFSSYNYVKPLDDVDDIELEKLMEQNVDNPKLERLKNRRNFEVQY